MKRSEFCRAVGRTVWLKEWMRLAIVLIAAVAGAQAAIPPDQGPGGPILIVTSAANPFTKYYAEILRAEGLNSFSVIDGTQLSPSTLNAYDVVVLGQFALTAPQVTMLNDYVAAGGSLIAMRPDAQLAGLLGISPTGSTLTDQYLLIDNTTAAGSGLVKETIQFHGAADLYNASGASILATLYSSSTSATPYPAVTWKSVGYYGGQVAAFTFDLARSIVYTRQGNPAWQKQLRDPNPGCNVNGAQPCVTGVQVPPIMAYDLFYGPASFDPKPSWIDFSKITIPQADEQQRLLANLVLLMNVHRKPIPRFWYFPRGNKAVVIMTGDDHANGGTQGRFETYKAASPAGCAVNNWECIRSTSYIYSNSPLTDAQAASYNALGFEVAAHLHTNCTDWTSPTGPNSYFQNQLYAFSQSYPSLPAPTTNRTHCTPWSDYSSHALAEFNKGIRLDTTFYYYPATWVQDRPGLFTGSGMPMRFAAIDGTMIDVYQAVTQMTDQSGMTYSNHISSLLDKALGNEGYYGAFTANMHTDNAISAGSDAILGAALLRRVPVVSSKQMLTWLDGRNNSYFGGLSWANNLLSFTIAAGVGADGMQAMLPTTSAIGPLVGINLNGSPVTLTKQVIKGLEYAFFPAVAGSYTALYAFNSTPPDTVITSAPASLTNNTSAAFTFVSTKNDGAFTCSLDGTPFVTCSSPRSYPSLSSGGHSFAVRATDLAGNTDPSPATYGWTIGNFALTSLIDTTVTDFSAGAASNTYLTRADTGEVTLAPAAGAEFFGSALPAGWSSTPYVSGGGVLFGNGVASISGTLVGPSGSYGAGRSMEFLGTFTTKTNQHVGFSGDLTGAPWAIFSTWNGGGLYARTSNGTKVRDTLIPGNWLSAPHRFRIDWNAGNVDFYIDGSLVAAHSITFASNMRPLIADAAAGGAMLTISWIRMTPYASSGTFLSRVFDAGTTATWGTASWNAATPVGTSLGVSVRTGNTPTPDGNWTGFTALAASGAAIPAVSRYLQYSAALTTTDSTRTPVLNDVTINYVGGSAPPPPPPSTNPPAILSVTPTNVTAFTATINWTTDKPADGQVEFASPCPSTGCSTAIVSALSTSHSIDITGLSASTTYTYRVKSRDSQGLLSTSNYGAFTTAASSGGGVPVSGASLWSNSTTPANLTYADPRAIEVGVRFKSDVAGAISAIRFYKGPQNTGTHTVSLWTTSGTLLARGVSSGETAQGWQQVNFASPVNISANTAYVASYHTTSGYYSYNYDYFLSQYDSAPLHALPDATSGGNGLWVVSTTPTFPTQNYRAMNFWVDVVLTPPVVSTTYYYLWGNSGSPANVTYADPRAIEVGVKFKSDVDGSIAGIRFYKGPQNTGTHTVSLWTTGGTLLARSVSTGETASGWQQTNFASPVNISANTTYVASYHTTSGYYSYNYDYFLSQYDRAPLHALADGASGGNGIWINSLTPTFPTQNYRAMNFWVDPVLTSSSSVPSPPAPAPPPPTPQPPPTGATYYYLWGNSGSPARITEQDPRAIELGMKFKSDIAGAIYGIRFYKGPQNTGTHTVSLWTTSGTLLGRAVSSGETASGWQQVNFASPVNISANTPYIASYHTTSGYYSVNEPYFGNGYDAPPLHALPDGSSGGNGVYQVSGTPTFPSLNYNQSNFWVDVVLGPTR